MTEKRLYELVPYDCQDGSCLVIHEKTRDSKLGALSLDHKSIGEAIIDELNNLAEENEQLKQRINELEESLGFCRDLLDGTCNSTRMKELHKIIGEMVTDD